jgi:hypothetical protein
VQAQLTTVDFDNGSQDDVTVCQGPLDSSGDGACFMFGALPPDISFDSSVSSAPANLVLISPVAGEGNTSFVLYTNIPAGSSMIIDFTGGGNTAIGMELFCVIGATVGIEIFWSAGSSYQEPGCSLSGNAFIYDAGASVITQVVVSPVAEGDFVGIDNVTFTVGGGSSAPSFSCEGFAAPMANHPVKVRKNRALPLKMQLFDAGGFVVTDLDVAAAPLIQVLFEGAGGEPTDDVSDDALPTGHGSDGNEFEFTDDGLWQYNLKSNNYSATGTYTISVRSGDEAEYTVDPTCESSFVVK